jgi:ankyrin repeat protein
MRNSDNHTPLHVAARHGYASAVLHLLDDSGDLRTRKRGPTPLALARRHGHRRVADLISRHERGMSGADAGDYTGDDDSEDDSGDEQR